MLCDKCKSAYFEKDIHVNGYQCSSCGALLYRPEQNKDGNFRFKLDEEVRFVLNCASSSSQQRSTYDYFCNFRTSILRSILHLFKSYSNDIKLKRAVISTISALLTDVFLSKKIACVASKRDYLITMHYFETLDIDRGILLDFVTLCFGENIEDFNLDSVEDKLTESRLYMLCWYYDLIGKPDVFFLINDKFKKYVYKHKLISMFRVVALCLFLAIFFVLVLQLTIWSDRISVHRVIITGLFGVIFGSLTIKLIDFDLRSNVEFLRKYDGMYDIIKAKEDCSY